MQDAAAVTEAATTPWTPAEDLCWVLTSDEAPYTIQSASPCGTCYSNRNRRAIRAAQRSRWPAPHPSGVPSYDSTIDMNRDAAREALEAVGEA